jgi:hypothetical protein
MKRVAIFVILAALTVGFSSCSAVRHCQAPEVEMPGQIASGYTDSLTIADLSWWQFYGDSTLRRVIELTLENNKEELEKKVEELKKVIKENKKLISSDFILNIKNNLIKYGKIVFGKEIAFSIGFNTSDNIDFDIKVENNKLGFDNSLENGHTIKKLLCFIFSASIVEAHKSNNFFKFLAFDSPFDGDKNTYQEGTYKAIKEFLW